MNMISFRFWNNATRCYWITRNCRSYIICFNTWNSTEASLIVIFGESSGSCGAVLKLNWCSSGYKGRFYFKIGDGTADRVGIMSPHVEV